MPVGMVKTKTDEDKWRRAKTIVSDQRNKREDDFTDRDWGLVNHIYQGMVKASTVQASPRMRVLLGSVEGILAYRESIQAKKNKDQALPDDAAVVVEALKSLMSVGGQAIAALRETETTGLSDDEAEDLASKIRGTAKSVKDLLSKVK